MHFDAKSIAWETIPIAETSHPVDRPFEVRAARVSSTP